MSEAHKIELDIFLHATKEGVPLYRHLGFYVEREIIQDDTMYGGMGEHYTCLMTYAQEYRSQK